MNEEHTLVKDKLRASSYHFFGSLLLVLIAAYLIFGIWYPSPFFKLFQVNQVFLLLIFVDLVLGPLCTFIVFKKNKKTLKIDLSIILLVQILAFGAGLWQISEARPAWLVLHKSVIYATSPNMLVNESGNQETPPIMQQNWGKPHLVLVKDSIIRTNEDAPVIYQLNNFTAITPKTLQEEKLSLDNIKAYNTDFHQDIINQFPQATGYIPILTEASMNVPALLIDDKGEVVTILHDKYYEKKVNKQ